MRKYKERWKKQSCKPEIGLCCYFCCARTYMHTRSLLCTYIRIRYRVVMLDSCTVSWTILFCALSSPGVELYVPLGVNYCCSPPRKRSHAHTPLVHSCVHQQQLLSHRCDLCLEAVFLDASISFLVSHLLLCSFFIFYPLLPLQQRKRETRRGLKGGARLLDKWAIYRYIHWLEQDATYRKHIEKTERGKKRETVKKRYSHRSLFCRDWSLQTLFFRFILSLSPSSRFGAFSLVRVWSFVLLEHTGH